MRASSSPGAAQAEAGSYRPVTVLSLAVDRAVWGGNPAGFHLTNLFLHWITCCLLMHAANRIFHWFHVSRPGLLSFNAALLFCVLASHSEPVAWVIGRTDLLAGVFSLASLHFFMKHSERPSPAFGILALSCFALALLSKESAIVIPLVWGALLCFGGRRNAPSLRLLMTAMLLMFMAAGARLLADGHLIHWLASQNSGFSVPSNIARFVLRVFTGPYPAGIAELFTSNPILASVPIIAALLVVLLAGRGRPLLVFCGVSFLLCLAAVSKYPVGLTDTQSERLLYLPGAFACMFLAGAADSLLRGRKAVTVLLFIVAVIQVPFLLASNRNWAAAGRATATLVSALSAYDPDSVVVLNLPDNYRGAYMLRNGVDDAVRMVSGRRGGYRVILKHSLPSETVILADSSGFRLTFSGGACSFDDHGLDATLEGNSVHLAPAGEQVLIYHDGSLGLY